MHTSRSIFLAVTFWSLLAGVDVEPARAIEPAPPGPSGGPSAPSPADAPIQGPTTLADLFEFVRTIDPEAKIQGHAAQFRIRDRDLILVGDEAAGRMRIMTPVAPVAEIGESILRRMLQANFDAVLDARYAIADGIVWSAYIHPLPSLGPAQFESAIEQVWTAADTFGTTYSSGTLIYRGGDSEEEHRKLLESAEPTADPSI